MTSVTLVEDHHIDFWTCEEGAGELTHTDYDEAIDNCLGEMASDPVELIIYGHKIQEITVGDVNPDGLLCGLLEDLNETYGNQFGDTGDQPLADLREAAESFAKEVVRLYVVWTCDMVREDVVIVSEWRKTSGNARHK